MISYLVDTENVGLTWAQYLKNCLPIDKFYLFFSKVSPAITMPVLDAIFRSKVQLECIECYQGINAMDFQLISYLGFLIAKSPNDAFTVVSRDKGYDPAINRWIDRGISVKRLAPGPATSSPHKGSLLGSLETKTLTSEQRGLLQGPIAQKVLSSGASPEHTAKVVGFIEKVMELPQNQRQDQVYRLLIADYGQAGGLKIYNKVKKSVKTILTAQAG